MMPIFRDELSSHQGTQNFPEGWQNFFIRNGFFRYQIDGKEARDSGLTDLTIEIKRHEKIGVVGKSGSGKSTFAKMLLGLYDLEKGEYKFGDKNFHSIRHSEVTNKMALVLQDSEMFNLSLKDNITLMRKFDQKLFDQALEISALNDLVEKLPEGVDALIGEKGYRLSGGERQRIGIARAIYKDPEILILDEATSSLDSRTESSILKAFEDKLAKKTIVSIAHRVSTLKNSDRIVVFDQGSIVEEGKFKDLSKNENSKFFEIYHSQQVNAKVIK
jgi:ABC-type multidrug transport system fused ATPase/permease subunit